MFGQSVARPITEAQEEPEKVECYKCNGTGKTNKAIERKDGDKK
jgi:hypothetical protein